jgi:hypothetical protein
VSANDVIEVLIRQSLYVGQVRGPKDGDEDLGVELYLVIWTIDRKGVPGEVDEGLSPRHVTLAHGWREGVRESSVVLAELGVAIAIGMGLSVLRARGA